MAAVYQHNLIGDAFPFNIIRTDIFEFPPHWHEDIEVIYNLDEPFDIGIRDQIHTLNKGDIMIVDSKEVHYFLAQSIPRKRLIIQFKSRLLNQYIVTECQHKFSNPIIRKDNDNLFYNDLKKHIMHVEKETANKLEGFEYVIMARLYDMIALLMRNLQTITVSSTELDLHQSKLVKLTTVFDYVESHYDKEIKLEDISSVAGYSSYYFTRFFKASTGMTFMNYLNHFRINKAIEELLLNDGTIFEISLNSGFGSIKTFNRVFKSIKGCTPTAYKTAISDHQLSNFGEIYKR